MTEKRFCLVCGAELTKESQKIYCSNACAVTARRRKAFAAIEASGEFPSRGRFDETNRYIARLWLEDKNGHRCSICGLSEWRGEPITLIVDHIDGNTDNNKIENFRLVCPNCDSQLPTYKNRNASNPAYTKSGRAERKVIEYDRMLDRHGLSRAPKRTRATAICPICQKEFTKKHSKQVYCSKPCVAEALRERAHR